MKANEIFKLYNLKNMKSNTILLLLLSVSIMITMTISLVIPQLEAAKQKEIDHAMSKCSDSSLMITQSYPSEKFYTKLFELQKKGLKIDQINYAPIYMNINNNKNMLYLFSGYEYIKKDTAVISKNLADDFNIKVGDKIKLDSINLNEKVTVSAIENLPVDITDTAQITGYIKTNNIIPTYNSDMNIYLLDCKDPIQMKDSLKKIEPGFSYKTYDERYRDLFQHLDIQIAALNLISIVGYLLAIAVCLTGLMMIVVKSKTDIVNMILMGIDRKTIIKAFKKEINITILIPLILSILFSIPITNLILKSERLVYKIGEQELILLVLFSLFSLMVFMLYRNLSLSSIKSLDCIEVQKKNSIFNKKTKKKIKLGVVFIPFIMIAYTMLLLSGTSVMLCLMMLVFIILLTITLYFLFFILAKLPIRKFNRIALYVMNNIYSNKIFYIMSILNLTLLLLFSMIGFHLSAILQESADLNLKTKLPYNLMMKSDTLDHVVQVLKKSKDVTSFTIMNYDDVVNTDERIRDKKIRLNEIKRNEYHAKFQVIDGKNLFEGDKNGVLIARDYANAYKYSIGDKIYVNSAGKEEVYKIKGIYESGGINSNWILKESENHFTKSIILVNSKNKSVLNELKDTFVADADSIGHYIQYQMEYFLNSFKLICLIFALGSLVFNINLMYLLKDLDKKDDSIIRAVGLGKDLLVFKEIIKVIFIAIISVIISLMIFVGILMVFKMMFSIEILLNIKDLLVSDLMIISLFVIVNMLTNKGISRNDLLNMKEI